MRAISRNRCRDHLVHQQTHALRAAFKLALAELQPAARLRILTDCADDPHAAAAAREWFDDLCQRRLARGETEQQAMQAGIPPSLFSKWRKPDA